MGRKGCRGQVSAVAQEQQKIYERTEKEYYEDEYLTRTYGLMEEYEEHTQTHK